MVVVSENWLKNAPTYPSQPDNGDVNANLDATGTMAAKAVLTCRPNSHLFQDRTLTLDQPLKVGRSVARAKPTATNAIFDCKVLSRHHALLWYENGKFFLQDTKSSNGTFVNNNRLTAESENHELSSGDIVQFGVDVVENNRKVTHGCIIATIKLYLPDGKEAKASPVDYEDRHGMVPLDDLYRLNQIIQEACHREKYLEKKLDALQSILEDTKRSTHQSWQAYVGEEKLLSRVSTLEAQLQQVNKSWGSEDRLKEELTKLQVEYEAYQISAKETLDKTMSERLHAIDMAVEQERAKKSAEENCEIAKELFDQAQKEVQDIAQQMSNNAYEAGIKRKKLQEREQELEKSLEKESNKLLELQLKLHELSKLSYQDFHKMRGYLHHGIIHTEKDEKSKEKIIAEEEEEDNDDEEEEEEYSLFGPCDNSSRETEEGYRALARLLNGEDPEEDVKQVTFDLPEECQEQNDNKESCDTTEDNEKDSTYNSDDVDSKTLKYQFQSAQKELKQQIELLEAKAISHESKIAELMQLLEDEKIVVQQRLEENQNLRHELGMLQQKWKETCNENQQYKDRVENLGGQLETAKQKLKANDENVKEKLESEPTPNTAVVPYERLMEVEEEHVALKERFSRVVEEKLKLQRELVAMTDQYRCACNQSHNKYFFYVAPLVFMVLYLLISAMIS